VTRVTSPSRADVIGRVAHDLRATLNAVAGWGGVLEAGPLSAEDVRRAGAAVSRQAHLTSRRLDLALDFWRLDVGLIELTPAAIPAATMAQAAVAGCASVAVERGVACDVTADATLLVSVHGQRFSQALGLLVEEVISLAPVGGRIAVGVAREDDNVRFELVPVGGSPRRAATTSPFTRSLAVALVEIQGGRVDAGDAGTFTVTVPCAPASPSIEGT
jgi:two-component system CheB/CheR fusion protein